MEVGGHSEREILHKYVGVGNISTLNWLLDCTAISVDERNVKGETALHIAVAYGNSLTGPMALDRGKMIDARYYRGKISVHTDVMKNCRKMVTKLLDSGASINLRDNEGNTPLHIAVRMNRYELVEDLLNRGAIMDIQNNDGQNPLDLAMIHGNLAVANKLITHGMILEDKKCRELAFKAISWNSMTLLCNLLDRGVAVDTVVVNGETLLHTATKMSHVAIVGTLLDRGANINAVDNSKRTSLNYALFNFDLPLIHMLIDRGANTNISYENGFTPIHAAVRVNSIKLLDKLLLKGWDVDVKTKNNDTPLHTAVKNNNLSMVQLLIERGAYINSKNYKGNTPLHYAVHFKDLSIIDFLLVQGADINAANNKRETALHFAANIEHGKDIVERLLNGGANVDAMNIKGQHPFFIACSRSAHSANIKPSADILAYHRLKLITLEVNLGDEFYEKAKVKSKVTTSLVQSCVAEIDKMKNTIIYRHYSLYIVFEKKKCPNYLRNPELTASLEEAMNSSNFRTEFPHYCNIFINTYKKCKKIIHLLDLAKMSLSNLLGPQSHLPNEIILNIVELLDEYTLRQLVKSGFYLAPLNNSNLSGVRCEHLNDVNQRNLLNEYLSDSLLDKLLETGLYFV
uniref:Uncharacterized protein n=1 Tax=Cuerna arida TaxID=1464854 RepID=A0A1B6FN48_9HEMI